MRKEALITAVMLLAAASTVWATPYASGIIDLGGGDIQFTLNESAGKVEVRRTGDTTLNLGVLGPGTHTFNVGAASAWQIVASKNAAPGWAQISSDSNVNNQFYTPRGVAVNANPASTYFGRIYVAEGGGGATAAGRTTTSGLFLLNADGSSAVGQGDSARTGGVDWTTSSSGPFRLAVGANNGVYITDWSDSHSGVWRANAVGSGSFVEVLDNTGRDGAGLVAGVHGSIPAVYVEGTGANRKMYTMDEDLDLIGETPGSILQYDLGNDPGGYSASPSVLMNDQIVNGNVILNLRTDLDRDGDGNWYISQYRFTESAGAPSLTKYSPDGSTQLYNSGAAGAGLDLTYGSLAIHKELGIAAMGRRSGGGTFILDVSGATPTLLTTLATNAGYTQDVAFDAGGNLYAVSSSDEVLRVFSPGGHTVASTFSDGTFALVPEPATMVLLGLGGLAILLRRRR